MNSTDLTTAWILRAAPAYVLHNGLYLPEITEPSPSTDADCTWSVDPTGPDYDWASDPNTPAATPEGAIAFVVYGEPTTEPAETDPEWSEYQDALAAYYAPVICYIHGRWSTAEGIARELLWAALSWELDWLICPVCDQQVAGVALSLDIEDQLLIPHYRHYQSDTSLCAVIDPDGVGPAEPQLRQAVQG